MRSRSHYSDAALAVLLLMIIALMIIPVPTPLLDVLIASNIALAVIMLLVSIAVPSGLGFAAMPTILLVTTLYRLALNVSSTRLILLQADAGRVIQAFGEYVVRGNYLVGAVVFFVLTLIQYVVIARGSERVAEVGARFTLDAMPGKQLAIDADLRAGTLTPQDARVARRMLERENQFYGAMDGAMKFVKGDAIAGIVITVVNIVAGVAIGVGMRKLGAIESLQTYGLLTIGDGLVCQIPALLISTSAGLVVTRVASQGDGGSLGTEVGTQLFGNRRVLWMAAAFLALLAVVPGLPALPFGLLSLLLAASAYALRRTSSSPAPIAAADATSLPLVPRLAPIAADLGPELGAELRQLESAVESLRERLSLELGLSLTRVPLRMRPDLPARGYALRLFEVPLEQSELPADLEAARQAERLLRALENLVRARACELIGLQETQQLLDALERSAPALVRNTVPKPVSLRLLTDVLRGLLSEQVSIRPLPQILETLAGETSADSRSALERARLGLRRHIVFAHARDGKLAVHPVDVMVEDAIRDAVTPLGLALPPDQAREIVAAVRTALGMMGMSDPGSAVLITQPDVRPHLRRTLEVDLPEVAVIGYPELCPELSVEKRMPIRIGVVRRPAQTASS